MKIHPLRSLLLPFLALMAAAIFSGCLDVDQEITLNPDGSGKVTLDAMINMPFLNMLSGSKEEQQKELNKFARPFIESSMGVDVWKDVSCTKSAKGYLHFKGTAYFTDLTRLSITMGPPGAPHGASPASSMSSTIERAGDSMTITFGAPPTSMGPAPGTMNHFRMPPNPAPGPDSSGTAESPNPFSGGDDQADADTSTRGEFGLGSIHLDTMAKQLAGTMGRVAMGMYSDMRLHIVVNVPGRVKSTEVFVAETGNRVSITFPDTATTAKLKALVADNQYWEKLGNDSAESEPQAPALPEELSPEGLSIKKTPRIVVTDARKPLFDYGKETRAAKKNYPALKKKFGIHEKGQFSLLSSPTVEAGADVNPPR